MMGGGDSSSSPPYQPTTKSTTSSSFSLRKTFLLLLSLSLFSYLLGAYQNGTRFTSLFNTNKIPTLPLCTFNRTTTTTTTAVAIDFNVTSPTPRCSVNYTEYTPCEDPKRSTRYKRSRMIYRERHCPKEKWEALKCRVPAPYGYRNPFPWPTSRDVAWYANVPHRELTVEKAVQNWVQYEGDRFRFPGGGTMFPNGAGAYIDDIGKLINLKDGSIRTALDTGCGVASWGAYLLSRDVLTMSIAPRDTHEAQVQFALERGVPAMIGVLASKRLPFPSRAFDMSHCSRCLIPWAQYDGIFLNEVDRVLRPGGYWILSGPPIHWKKHWKGWARTEKDLNEEQLNIEKVATSLCWNKVVEKDDIAIWQKPLNHFNCKARPICNPHINPDTAWYADMQTCLSPMPEVSKKEETAGGVLDNWPRRLNSTPPRIYKGTIEGVTSQTFSKDYELWKKRVSHYKKVNNQLGKAGRYRNLLDMNANFGGFAAALIEDPVWVMNVVPVHSKVNTLGAIYERGLIGTYHDWCEAMSTYPRTYDLIHADSLFSLYSGRCDLEDILVEMDRVLRPEGSVIIRDDVDMLLKVKSIMNGLEWESQIVEHEDGSLQREKLLFAVKKYWTAPADSKNHS
ncbi:unnamed protein product [Lupinus luteus]|uniref:Methyltransferase n=1 Tax=Lupinus luteus TaxID=3873 RepID=A0AAV1VV12_LUPLU